MFKNIISLSLIAFCSSAFSQAIELGTLSHRGNGCPQGTLKASTDELGESIYLSASQYYVELSASKKLDRKSCQIALPLKLAADKKLVLKKVYLAGAQLVQEGDLGKLSAELFLAGDTGLKLDETLNQYGYLFVKALKRDKLSNQNVEKRPFCDLILQSFLSSQTGSESAVYLGLGAESTFAKLEIEIKDCQDHSDDHSTDVIIDHDETETHSEASDIKL